MWFSIPYFRPDPKVDTYIPSAHASQKDSLTYWLIDYQTKLINEWLNEWKSLWCPLDLSQVFFPLWSPNQGSHMMDDECIHIITIRTLTGMLISNEEKTVRWQILGVISCGSKNSSKLLISRLELFERSWTRGNKMTRFYWDKSL